MAAVALGQMHIAIRRNTDLLRESRSSRYSRRKILASGEFSRLAAIMHDVARFSGLLIERAPAVRSA
jgi:hypothetical protein